MFEKKRKGGPFIFKTIATQEGKLVTVVGVGSALAEPLGRDSETIENPLGDKWDKMRSEYRAVPTAR